MSQKTHNIDEEQVLASAKSIMDDFFSVLAQRTDIALDNLGLNRQTQTRDPNGKTSLVEGEVFKQKILANATQKNQDCIIAEKKHW